MLKMAKRYTGRTVSVRGPSYRRSIPCNFEKKQLVEIQDEINRANVEN